MAVIFGIDVGLQEPSKYFTVLSIAEGNTNFWDQ